jgi:hypothetical protein
VHWMPVSPRTLQLVQKVWIFLGMDLIFLPQILVISSDDNSGTDIGYSSGT